MIDDSSSMLFTDEGFVDARISGRTDHYLFAYVKDYQGALRDFYKLSGSMPVVPRWALGNWWSRYHPYSDKEYIALMDKFNEEKIPLSVAVLDMDWHIVKEVCRQRTAVDGRDTPGTKIYFPIQRVSSRNCTTEN